MRSRSNLADGYCGGRTKWMVTTSWRYVSYLFAAERPDGELDLAGALDRLATLFGVRTLLLEGGGAINGSLLRDGLVDELSLLVAPVADGSPGTPSLFDVAATEAYRARRLHLQAVEQRSSSVVWLRYRVELEEG